MTFAEITFHSACSLIQSVCLVFAMVNLYRAGKRLDDLYSLMVKELWNLRGLIEITSSVESLDKESGKNSKFTGTDL